MNEVQRHRALKVYQRIQARCEAIRKQTGAWCRWTDSLSVEGRSPVWVV